VRLSPPLLHGVLLGRRKRFFVDVGLPDGSRVVAHCPNTGRLLGCLTPGASVVLQGRSSARRTLPWTWVLVRPATRRAAWIGIDTALAVPLVLEAVQAGHLPELAGFTHAHREVIYGRDGRSRIDLVFSDAERLSVTTNAREPGPDANVWVEVKSTTLVEPRAGQRVAAFPDAVTARGQKHIEELEDVVRRRRRAVLLFAVQRADADVFAPADAIDPDYGRLLRRAAGAGVELIAIAARIRNDQIALVQRLPVAL
jgi:sugar fermentation stimulation protein A